MTSQQAIEEAMRKAGLEQTAGREFSARMVLTIEELDLEHTVDGKIAGKSE